MKIGKYAKIYAVVTQGLISMVVLLLLGYWIGTKLWPNTVWPGVIATFGAIAGLINFIRMLLKLGVEKNE